jgi:hypothetical protein
MAESFRGRRSALYWRSERNFLPDVDHGARAGVRVPGRRSERRADGALPARGQTSWDAILLLPGYRAAGAAGAARSLWKPSPAGTRARRRRGGGAGEQIPQQGAPRSVRKPPRLKREAGDPPPGAQRGFRGAWGHSPMIRSSCLTARPRRSGRPAPRGAAPLSQSLTAPR